MPLIDDVIVHGYLTIAANVASTTSQKGKALEDLVAYVFGLVPGISVTHRNKMNVFNTEEVDVAIFNDGVIDGFHYLPSVVLIECKNWSSPVSSNEVSWFISKLRSRGLDFGILVATNGITGDVADLNAAHIIIAHAQAERRRIVVISTAEISSITDTNDLSLLIKQKLCQLAVHGSIL